MLRNKAFSLAEAVIALAITCVLLALGSFCMDNFNERMLFENSVRQTTLALEQAARVASIKHEVVFVNYFASSGYLHIKGGSDNYQEDIRINPEVRIDNLKQIYISREGTISPRTLRFASKDFHREIKIQMMWGKADG